MAWLMLVIAIVTEVIATTALTWMNAQFKPVPLAIVVVGYLISFIAMARALRDLDVAVVYALWSAVGIAAIAVIGAVVFDQVLTPARVAWLTVIVIGVIGLQLFGGAAQR